MKILIAAMLCSWTMALPPLISQAHDHASMETLGSVTFSTSCSPPVQSQFNHALTPSLIKIRCAYLNQG